MKTENYLESIPKLIDKKAVAAILDCSIRQVDYLRKEPHNLPFVPINGLIKFNLQSVLKWIQEQEVNT